MRSGRGDGGGGRGDGARTTVYERGCAIDIDDACFYRAESAQSRDLSVLCCAATANDEGIDAYDATCASGARAVRWMRAGFVRSVVCNDVNANVEAVLEKNLSRAAEAEAEAEAATPAYSTTFEDAQRELTRAWLDGQKFDIVDVDGFGSANFADAALRVVRYGGLFYACSTDGRALCGQNPSRLQVAFGNAVVAPSRPAVNEIALRTFIGDVVRRGAALKLDVVPVFSLFHAHGPVFRAMFRVVGPLRGAYGGFGGDNNIGFVGHCDACGNTSVVDEPLIRIFHHNKLEMASTVTCARCKGRDADGRSAVLALSGPLWIGPLHNADVVHRMRDEAERLGWLDDPTECKEKGQMSLEDLLDAFVGEALPALNGVAHYFRTDELARKGRAARVPPRDVLTTALRAHGFAATRSHIDPRGLKTNASVQEVVKCANDALSALDAIDGR